MSPNLIVGQSGGPTAVINASLAGVVEEALGQPDVDRVLGMRQGIQGVFDGNLIDLTDPPPDTLNLLAATPGAALGACRRKITEDEAGILVSLLAQQHVGYVCYIGGNDSADTTQKLARAAQNVGYEIRAIAVPKTIDNDLPETDHCPGYASAARYVAIAASESTLDTLSLPANYPVKIIEVMGRDAGWLAAASGLARTREEDGPHLVYVPEFPFDTSAFLTAVQETHAWLGYAVVVVAETVRDGNGNSVATDVAFVDDFGHPMVRGTAETLVRMVTAELGLQARADKPGSLQRSSRLTRSPVDVAEAREAGREAVRLAVSGHSGRMVTIERASSRPYVSRMSSVAIERIANMQRLLPREYLDTEGTFISEAFREYALPLLGPDPFPKFFRF